MRFLPALSFLPLALLTLDCGGGDNITKENPVALTAVNVAAIRGVVAGVDVQLKAMATYDNGASPDVSSIVVWSSSDTNVAVIDGQKLKPIAAGTFELKATLGAITNAQTITVDPVKVKDVLLSTYDTTINKGETLNLGATLEWNNGTSEDGTSTVMWTSDNPRVLSVDVNGVVTALAGGEAMISATYGDVVKQTHVGSDCSYPQSGDSIIFGQTFPNLHWDHAFDRQGNEFSASLQDMYCSPDWNEATAIFFVVSAGWCPHCPEFMQYVEDNDAEFEAAGARFVFVEVQDVQGAPADSADGVEWLSRHSGSSSMIAKVGDSDVLPSAGVFGRSPMVVAFPDAIGVRKSDMKIFVDQLSSNYYLDFTKIASHTDLDWTHPDSVVINNCPGGTEEASEPNNRPSQAGVLEAGVTTGGSCGDQDYFQVRMEGAYKIALDFNQSLADLDIYVYNDTANQILEVNGVKVGSYGDTGHEEFEYQGWAYIRVETKEQGASAPYTLTLTPL